MNKQTPPSTPPRKLNNISSNDLDPDYLIFLQERIPILNNEYLLKPILEYCKIKNILDKKEKIREIKNILKKMFINVNNYETLKINNYEQLKVNNNKKLHVLKKNNKIIKLQEITAEGLIEAIINITLYYYELNEYTVNSRLNIIKINNMKYDELNNKKRFMQIMNLAKGTTLGDFIINLYSNKNIDTYEKDNYILDIFKTICNKLDFLQKKYLFIHGDFHSGNIMIDEDENIKFIDFGFSSIKLPSKNKKIILTTPVECNIERNGQLDLNEDPYLKTIDMYHLIENLYDFCTSPDVNFNNKNDFKNFLVKLKKIYYKEKNPQEDMHIFERKNNFQYYVDYKELLKDNFYLITIDDLNKLYLQKSDKKRKLNNDSFKNKNNSLKPKSLFNNNN